MATNGFSMGISESELYGTSTNAPEAIWSGVSQGLAGLAAAYRSVEQQRAANRDVGMDALISALETRGQDVESQRRRDAGYAAGGLLLERDTTSYLANLAKSDVSTQAEKFAQAKIAMGRETASKNFMAQMTLTPLMDYVTNSASHAGRALAVAAIRSSPVFSDTSAAFKNSLQGVNKLLIDAGDGKKYGAAMDLNGGPATYQAMAATILDERADPETKVNAAASLIILSTAIGDAIPDSELARFVTPDILQCAKARAAAFTRLGVDATTMGFMSDRGMERLDGVVRSAEDALASLGYTVDADGVVSPANDATRDAYNRAVADAKDKGGAVELPESVMTAAQGVVQARRRRQDLQKLWDGVQALGPAEFKAAWEQGHLPALSAFSQSISAQVASGERSREDADKLTRQAQYHIGKAAGTWDIDRNRSRLGDDLVSSYGFSDDILAKPQKFSRMIVPTGDLEEVDAALNQAWVSFRSDRELAEDTKLDNLTDPGTINFVAGWAAARQLVKINPAVRKAFVGVGGLPTPDDEADEAAAIKLIGDKIGERLNDRLNGKSVYSINENGNREWKLLGGEASGGFDGVFRSVVADAVADVANAQYLEHEAQLAATYQQAGVSLTGNENGASRYMLAKAEQKNTLAPADSKVEATDPVAPLPVTRMLKYAGDHPGASVLVLPEMSVASDEEVEKVNEEPNGAYAYQVSTWEGETHAIKRPVLPQGAPMPGMFFRDPDAPGDGKPGIFFGKTPDPSVLVGGGQRLRTLWFNPVFGVGNSHAYVPSIPVTMTGYLKDEPQADIVFYGNDSRLYDLTPDLVFTKSQLDAGKQFMDAVAPIRAQIFEAAFPAETSGDDSMQSLDLASMFSSGWERAFVNHVPAGALHVPAGARIRPPEGSVDIYSISPEVPQSRIVGHLADLGAAVSALPKLDASDPSLGVSSRERQVELGTTFAVSVAHMLDIGFWARFDTPVPPQVIDGVITALKADKTGNVAALADAAGLPKDWLERLSALDIDKYVTEYRKTNGQIEGGFTLAFLHDLGAPYVPPSISVNTKITPVRLTTLTHGGAGADWASTSASATGASLPGVSVYPGAVVNLPPRAKKDDADSEAENLNGAAEKSQQGGENQGTDTVYVKKQPKQ